jgi:hypothetical protein
LGPQTHFFGALAFAGLVEEDPKRRFYLALAGLIPDYALVAQCVLDVMANRPLKQWWPEVTAYTEVAHSLLIIGAVFVVSSRLTLGASYLKRRFWGMFMFQWALHPFVDMFTHGRASLGHHDYLWPFASDLGRYLGFIDYRVAGSAAPTMWELGLDVFLGAIAVWQNYPHRREILLELRLQAKLAYAFFPAGYW